MCVICLLQYVLSLSFFFLLFRLDMFYSLQEDLQALNADQLDRLEELHKAAKEMK